MWKKKFANFGVTELRKLRMLEEENARLQRVVADLTLDRHILQEVLRKKSEAGPPPRARALDSRVLRWRRNGGGHWNVTTRVFGTFGRKAADNETFWRRLSCRSPIDRTPVLNERIRRAVVVSSHRAASATRTPQQGR